jgi:hypothetical protein
MERPVFSSLACFNYDFHVTLDEKVAPTEHNYLDKAELEKRKKDEPYFMKGEQHALSVFFRLDEDVFHTYQPMPAALNVSPTPTASTPTYGRQQEFEDSPSGWPQPTYG